MGVISNVGPPSDKLVKLADAMWPYRNALFGALALSVVGIVYPVSLYFTGLGAFVSLVVLFKVYGS